MGFKPTLIMAKIKPERFCLAENIDAELPPIHPKVCTGNIDLEIGYARSESKVPDYINPQIAYLLGFMRDGSVSGSNVELKQQSSNELLSRVIVPIIHRNFNKKVKAKNGRVVFKDKRISIYLRKAGNYQKGCCDTPEILNGCPEPIIKWYIRGFWDAEGGCPHIHNYVRRNKPIPVMITIVQCWKNGKECPPLEYIRERLSEFGIESHLYLLMKSEINRKLPRFRLSITSYKHIILFHDLIGSSHPKKGANLRMLSDCLRPLAAA
jgi:hypothetical protein